MLANFQESSNCFRFLPYSGTHFISAATALPPATTPPAPRRSSGRWDAHILALIRLAVTGRVEEVDRLSITHKPRRDGRAQRDISQARHAAPHDGVAGRRVRAAGEVAAEPRDLGQVEGQRPWSAAPVGDEAIQ